MTPHLPSSLLAIIRQLGAPAWYQGAVATPTTSRIVQLPDGTGVHLAFWNEGDTHKPLLFLIHGYRANTHAWDAVAPAWMADWQVVAVDLVGMGLSGWRAQYGNRQENAQDLAHLLQTLSPAGATVVAHSFGGACAIHLAQARPDLVSHLIVVDSKILFPDLDDVWTAPPVGGAKAYASYEQIISRYRLIPDQPCPRWALAYLAHHSVRADVDGWRWRFHPLLPQARMGFDLQAILPTLKVKTDYLYGEHSATANPQRLRRVEQALGQGRPAIKIDHAYHHAMLDQPLALIEAVGHALAS